MAAHRGSCLCGTVQYEVRGEFGPAIYCHCSRCRKASGTAFATNAPVTEKDFVVIAGAATLKTYVNAETGTHRIFCSNCGSPIISKRDSLPGVVRVRLGTLDTPLPHQQWPHGHYYVASKADWDEIHDGLPQHAER